MLIAYCAMADAHLSIVPMTRTVRNTRCTMTPADRKAELVRRGVTVSAIARRIGRTQGHVSNVLAGRRRAAVVEQAIADALGMPVERVFADAAA